MVFWKHWLLNPSEYYCVEAIKRIHFIIQYTYILSSFTQHVKSLQLMLGLKEPEFSEVMSKYFP